MKLFRDFPAKLSIYSLNFLLVFILYTKHNIAAYIPLIFRRTMSSRVFREIGSSLTARRINHAKTDRFPPEKKRLRLINKNLKPGAG